MRARSTGGVSAQSSAAASHARTARSTRSAPPIGVSAITSPVDGLQTFVVAAVGGTNHSPSMKTGTG